MSFFFVTEKSKMPSSATGVGMPICLLGGVLLILTQKNSQKFGDVLGIMERFERVCFLKWQVWWKDAYAILQLYDA